VPCCPPPPTPPPPRHLARSFVMSCRQFKLVGAKEEGTAQVVMLPLEQIVALSSVRVFIHKDLRPPENCQHGIKVHFQYFFSLTKLLTNRKCSPIAKSCCPW